MYKSGPKAGMPLVGHANASRHALLLPSLYRGYAETIVAFTRKSTQLLFHVLHDGEKHCISFVQ
jgi:hypothetical protein